MVCSAARRRGGGQCGHDNAQGKAEAAATKKKRRSALVPLPDLGDLDLEVDGSSRSSWLLLGAGQSSLPVTSSATMSSSGSIEAGIRQEDSLVEDEAKAGEAGGAKMRRRQWHRSNNSVCHKLSPCRMWFTAFSLVFF